MSEPIPFLDGKVVLHPGDCLDVLRGLADASIDSVVTDPPYALVSIVKRIGAKNAAPAKEGVYGRSARGFMGKEWDTGETAFAVEFWAEVLRVLKPGGHVLAFGGTRTYHRLVVAIEDAGFEIRDQIAWLYGSGFPKSHDVSKGIDKAAGAEREVVATVRKTPSAGSANMNEGWVRPWAEGKTTMDITAPATDEASRWQGWGTALKPAIEPICVARKPLDGTVAANVLKHGTGAINIDACRVGSDVVGWGGARGGSDDATQSQGRNYRLGEGEARPAVGRWPANIIHDGSDEVLQAFPESAGQQGDVRGNEPSHTGDENTACYGEFGRSPFAKRNDTGSAARFFYAAKADKQGRMGSKHPTVKPVDLKRYLVRLVTPPGGVVLDPFAGTGTTGQAAFLEGFRAVLVEREPEYQADIARRMELVLAGPDERARAITKAKGEIDDNAGPLFAGSAS
jgi:DNA modification methylase